jgi:hypothetical protein
MSVGALPGSVRTDLVVTDPGVDPIVVKPVDESLDAQYVFAIQAIAEGEATIISDTMTLNVGCGFWNEITEPADFNYTDIH